MSSKTTVAKELAAEEFSRTWNLEKGFTLTTGKANKDTRLGEIIHLKNTTTGQNIFAKERVATSKKEATQIILDLKNRMTMNNPNVIQLLDYTVTTQKKLCSTHYLIKSFYTFPETDTRRMLAELRRTKSHFSDADLMKIQNDVLNGLSVYHKNGMAHGDIRPEYIGYDKTSNNYVLLDRFNYDKPLEKLHTDYLIGKKEVYISPSLYSKIQGKNKTATYDGIKNDYHALGMTLLFLGLQSPVQNYYMDNGTVDKLKLQDNLNSFRTKYPNNPQLYESIVALTNPDESLRVPHHHSLNSALVTAPLVTAPLVVAPLTGSLARVENQVTHTLNPVTETNLLNVSSEQYHHS